MRGSDTCDPNIWDAREACQPGLLGVRVGTQWVSFSLSRKTTHRASLDYTVRLPFPKPKKLVWEEGPMRATDSLALLHLKLWLVPFHWERVKPPGSVQGLCSKDQIASSVKDQRVNSSGCKSQQSVSLHNHCVVKVKGLSMTRHHRVQLHAGRLWLTHPEDAQTLTRRGLDTLSPEGHMTIGVCWL